MAHAAIHQHLFKRAAARDDKNNYRNSANGLADDIHHLLNRTSVASAQRKNGDDNGNKQRHCWITDKFEENPHGIRFWQRDFTYRCDGHQNDRDHGGKNTVPE
ncbi:Uncharacterised protein [Salmonella enterica subsp. enterica serovar Bovismorbificans]|uniref:Uncharacterized protein n=1 Tax=Salmonella enterica subsp. enterica serovar Bovismorbificans TaxID=58097 RepID=A0A655DS66_SALET|nr:Uncharacterised protein [Salmonella enterica subsp. enterica serovar Bovismorbificans]